jgi:hypothetical protein
MKEEKKQQEGGGAVAVVVRGDWSGGEIARLRIPCFVINNSR